MQALARNACGNSYRGFGWLAQPLAGLCVLDPVIHGIAQKVQKGLLQHFEQRLVHLDLLALGVQVNLARK